MRARFNQAVHIGAIFAFMSLGFVNCQPAFAQSPAPTLAWRRLYTWAHLYNAGTNLGTYGPTTDAVGNHYFSYVVWTGVPDAYGYDWHFVKMSGANNIVFDKVVDHTESNDVEVTRNIMTPAVNGHQDFYLLGKNDSLDEPSGAYLAKFDLNGNPLWSGVHRQITQGVGQVHADAWENLFFIAGTGTFPNPPAIRMWQVDPNGNVAGDFADSTIYLKAADQDPVFTSDNKWIVGGGDPTEWMQSGTQNTAILAQFDAITGQRDFEYAVQGQGGAGSYPWVRHGFTVSSMRSGEAGIMLGNMTQQSATSSRVYTWSAMILSVDGSVKWQYPSSGQAVGVPVQADAYSTSSPVYLLGGNDIYSSVNTTWQRRYFLNEVDRAGNQLFSGNYQPADHLYTTPEGFFSTYKDPNSDYTFLERFDGATGKYDWGKSYLLGQNPFINLLPNALFVCREANGTDVTIDRFAIGISLQAVSCAKWARGTFSVTLSLNGPAPTRGLVVGLNSSNTKLQMPNGTSAQNFTIPAGKSSLVVNLSTQPVSANLPTTLLAIQNGVRRTANTTLIP